MHWRVSGSPVGNLADLRLEFVMDREGIGFKVSLCGLDVFSAIHVGSYGCQRVQEIIAKETRSIWKSIVAVNPPLDMSGAHAGDS